ncbi:MAG: cytochrome c oxidase assembly protein [Hyphomicrobiaceae bacterium]
MSDSVQHNGDATQAKSGPDALAGRHRRVAVILSGVVLGMVAAAYAAVPLYRIFCQTTGYGGTPKIAAENDVKILDRTIEVRLDANVAPNLPWRFKPKQNSVTVHLGETVLVHYQATNMGTATTRGTASYNVSPDASGAYFNKIACFCFTEQKLEPGETVDMPVTFFVDPAMVDDRDTARLPVITLSYTFHPMDKPAADATASPKAARELKGGGGQG